MKSFLSFLVALLLALVVGCSSDDGPAVDAAADAAADAAVEAVVPDVIVEPDADLPDADLPDEGAVDAEPG